MALAREWEVGRAMRVHHMTAKEDQSRRGVLKEKGRGARHGGGCRRHSNTPPHPSRLPKREEELQIPTVSARAAPS